MCMLIEKVIKPKSCIVYKVLARRKNNWDDKRATLQSPIQAGTVWTIGKRKEIGYKEQPKKGESAGGGFFHVLLKAHKDSPYLHKHNGRHMFKCHTRSLVATNGQYGLCHDLKPIRIIPRKKLKRWK